MAWLIPIEAPVQAKRYLLAGPCLIGRGHLNHIVLDDARISRQHAKISPEDGGYVLYDLNSANGTFVNNEPVKRRKLAPNDIVRFGPFRFFFAITDGAGASPEEPQFGRRMEVRTITEMLVTERILTTLDAVQAAEPQALGGLAGLAELEDADRKLRTLYAFMQSISSTLDVNELIERIVFDLLDVFPRAEWVALYQREPAGDMALRFSRRRDQTALEKAQLSVQVTSEVVRKGKAILSSPRTTLHGKPPTQDHLTMHAPLVYRGATLGVLEVFGVGATGSPFSQRDLDLLAGLAAQAGLALQNSRMHLEILQQHRLQQDLAFAREVQKSFLPRQLPVVDGLELVTEYQPAYSVGGDFYDIFWLSEGRLGMFIGDVAGKGVSAALLMARISSDLRVAALAEKEPARVLSRINRAVLERGQHDIFVTGVYVSLDTRTGDVTLANAGHLFPLVRRARRNMVETIDTGGGTAIGIFEEEIFPEASFRMEPGDVFLLCTDGVMEATNAEGEPFGFDRIRSCLWRTAGPARDIAARMLLELNAHVGDAPQYDDITLLLCGTQDALFRR